MPGNPPANRYSHTPRKVFEAYIDRMAIKRQRDQQDNRSDYQLIMKLIAQLREDHEQLAEHVAQHCQRMDPTLTRSEDATEGLE